MLLAPSSPAIARGDSCWPLLIIIMDFTFFVNPPPLSLLP
jgi:hypothetical protein